MPTQPSTNDEEHTAGEQTPLLRSVSPTAVSGPAVESGVPGRVRRRLYLSHFLSTWNSRVFEFGAVLYLATIFPGTLMPMSIYALTRGLSAILFASAIGQYIDTGNRLSVVRVSIVLQRVVVAASCVVFYLLKIRLVSGAGIEAGMLALTAALACVEKLASIMNMVSVEKDWVVVVAADDTASLRTMNAQMRRIDLMCKMLGPLFIALIDGISTELAIIVNFAMNVASVVVEYYAIARVYHDVPELQGDKQPTTIAPPRSAGSPQASTPKVSQLWQSLKSMTAKSVTDTRFYVRHRAFLPSFAGCLLYLTVLSFNGQMGTYLLSAGYSATEIASARMLSVAFEVLATWVAPWLMDRIGPVRAGLWLSSSQVSMLAAGTTVFWLFQDRPLISATGLVGGTILSRIGLRGFDLCTQLIVQEDVEAESRGAFSSVEAAWQNAFELLSYVSTIVFFRPDQFKWPSLISVVAVGSASAAYTLFVYFRRGHLFHLEKLGKLPCVPRPRSRRAERERVIEGITSRTDI
ncbi:iron-regulated transporter [Colletotrichum musicola]|uniref:Solute carrier family 40 member n=1 Tax=Colletotrichum musicola TaxID=2175873 RepID=A0A8H6MJ55_9PEZI|nr:iron-regulated transporter [Colletotrichum musicola]